MHKAWKISIEKYIFRNGHYSFKHLRQLEMRFTIQINNRTGASKKNLPSFLFEKQVWLSLGLAMQIDALNAKVK